MAVMTMRYRTSLLVVLQVSLAIDNGVFEVLVTAGAVTPTLHGTAHEATQQRGAHAPCNSLLVLGCYNGQRSM